MQTYEDEVRWFEYNSPSGRWPGGTRYVVVVPDDLRDDYCARVDPAYICVWGTTCGSVGTLADAQSYVRRGTWRAIPPPFGDSDVSAWLLQPQTTVILGEL